MFLFFFAKLWLWKAGQVRFSLWKGRSNSREQPGQFAKVSRHCLPSWARSRWWWLCFKLGVCKHNDTYFIYIYIYYIIYVLYIYIVLYIHIIIIYIYYFNIYIYICILYIYIFIYHDEIKSGNSIVSLNNVDMMICKSTNIVIIVVSLFVRVTAGLL